MGGPRRSTGESIEALEEAIDVIRLMWSGEHIVSFEGRHYRLADAHPGPGPPSDRALARRVQAADAAARRAQGRWLGPVARRARAPTSCEPATSGSTPPPRPPAVIRARSGASSTCRASSARAGLHRPDGCRLATCQVGEPLAGPPEWWAETLTGFAQDGFDTFLFLPARPVARSGRAASPARSCRCWRVRSAAAGARSRPRLVALPDGVENADPPRPRSARRP